MAQHVSIEPEVPEAVLRLQETFRDAMAQVAAPVSVVTTYAGGQPYGTTVSAFASLSMTPPMLLVSLQDSSHLLSLLRVGSAVGVNVLGAGQTDVAGRFAARREDKFAGVPWTFAHGAPVLSDTHAWVAMQVARLVPAGDHVLVLGDVVDAACGDDRPLTYHRRAFGTHHAH
jgi:flavin reductase (DIM6/NTAB) family NADH-FMN oxidoreductase RutF